LRQFSAWAIQKLSECGQINALTALIEERGRLHRSELLRNGGGYELIHANALFASEFLGCRLDGLWQAQGIC
jgi:hypothetical protein